MAEGMFLFYVSFFLIFESCFATNAAWKKSITAEHSCGVNKTELYYNITQSSVLPFQREISICDQSDPAYARPPEAMVDGSLFTFWQSEASRDDARITIELSGPYQKFYYVKSIAIFFGDYYRPGQIAFKKKSSSDESSVFTPWHYMVTESQTCEEKFGVPALDTPVAADSTLCYGYGSPALERGEKVTVELEGGRGVVVDPDTSELNHKLLDWMNATSVEIHFSGLRLFFDRLADRWQHYIVNEIEVSSYCHCNGQADGIDCPYNYSLGDRQCVCQEGACGINCESCCPAYNQYPYKAGTKGPFAADKDAACEKCNCHGHSDVCMYNETVAKNTCSYDNNATNDDCSMDIYGKYSGGGVCVNCKDNTEGINCQRCITGYFREKGKSQWDRDACQWCDCYQSGTKNTTRNGVQYLDCVRDEEEAAKLLDLDPGDCLCKNKTTGRRCDRCRDGYYNLTAENPDGCLACNCNTNGTVNGSVTCNDDGLCVCKERVQGRKCHHCENGTFNLAKANQYGCTRCVCSGITNDCSSSSKYRTQTNYSIEGWKLMTGLGSNEILPIMNIQEDVNGQIIEMISANITTGQSLYWMASENYFGGNSLVSAYGGNLKFTRKISSAEIGTSRIIPEIILKGPRNITIRRFLPPVKSLEAVSLSVKMVEFNWTHHDTDQAVDRNTFMFVLSKVHGIWITASYFSSGPDTYQTSFGNVELSSVSSNPDGNGKAVDVEQCACGKAYEGSSCERCARGYHRVNVSGHPFFGLCVPCNCHGHTLDCDPDSGECLNCQHNTTGFNCQSCKDGFYGEARNGTNNDCQKCPCAPPRTTTDLCSLHPNGSVYCLNCSQGYEKNLQCDRCELGYFGRPDLPGGDCSLCQCNNNSDNCDRGTGSCLGYCANNSTGRHCERCENGTFGDATKQQCRACTCNLTGSYDEPCNHRTGQCHCKPNVRGFNCSACVVNSYGFSDSGCQQCGCNQFGSSSLQCNESGVCECKNFTHGDKCDACEDNYYGLPMASCRECACNSTGSNSTVCGHVSGQCPCKDGVEGRQCDRCKIQHKGFSNRGCEPCPRCTQKLQSRVDGAAGKLSNSKHDAEQADQSINFYPVLDEIESKLPRVQVLQNNYSRRIENLEGYRQQLSNDTLSMGLADLEEREKKFRLEAEYLTSNISEELEKKEKISIFSYNTLGYANSVNQTTRNVIREMNELVAKSREMNESSSAVVKLLNQRVTEALLQEEREKNLSRLVEDAFNKATDAGMEIKNQTDKIEKLRAETNKHNSDLKKARNQTETVGMNRNKVLADIDDIKRLVAQVNVTIQNTNQIVEQTNFFINETNKSVAETENSYQEIENVSLPKLRRDLSELKAALNDVNNSLVNAAALVTNASRHAEELTTEAEELNRNFSDARRHGEKAVSSIERYDEITRKINNSVELSKQANKLVNELIKRIQNLSVTSQNLTWRVMECRSRSLVFLEATMARNLSISGLSYNVSVAYETFDEANKTCERVEVSARVFDVKSAEITAVATAQESLIHAYVDNSTKLATETLNISDVIENETDDFKRRVTEANKTVSDINSLVVNASNIMETSDRTANETELLLVNATQNVNESIRLLRENNRTKQQLTDGIAILEAKLKSAKEKVARFRLAMQLRRNTSVQLRPTNRTMSNPFLTAISLDFKTNVSNGLLFYMAPDPNDTHQSVSVRLVVDRVRFTYNLGSGPVVITNWQVPVADNMWHRIYATRYRDQARLTVTNLESGFSRTYEGPRRYYSDVEMKFNENSSIFLGGLPVSVKVNFTERDFDGALDNLVLNEEAVSLWNPLRVEGVRRFTARRAKPDDFDSCVTLHGNGFIQQRAGNFETRTNSSLSLQFRSFFKSALLVKVGGRYNEFIYGVYLRNGRVIFRYNTTVLSTNHSYYNDGQWYNVHITRTLKNASLLVTPLAVATRKPNDYVTVSRRLPSYLPDAEYIYFGGTNETSDRFAGGMKLISLSSIIANTPVRRNLDDRNFTVQSKDVSFDECIRTVEEGLRYSNGYTALRAENIKGISSLLIRFKSNEPTGLLAFSIKEEVRFYLALFHGNLFLVYANGSANEVTLQTEKETLNDGAYHTVQVEIRNSRIEMRIDTSPETLTRNLPAHVPTPVPLDDVLFIGGVTPTTTIPFHLPVLKSFEGDIKRVIINQTTVLDGSSPSVFESSVSKHVSAAGVPPPVEVQPTVAPTNPPLPPTCGSKYPEKVRSEKHEEIHFQGIDSVLGFSPNKSLLNSTGSSFVIVLEFRALSPNGVLFLAMDNFTNPSQFVSLELVDGSLVYQFNTGGGVVKMKTLGNYAIGGLWYTVNLLRIRQFGAIVIPESKEYHKDLRENTGQLLVVNSLYLGGIYGVVNTSMLENPSAPSFFGCIRKLSIQTVSYVKGFNLSGEADASQTKNIQPGQCYDYVQPQVSFDGAGYAKLGGTYNLSAGSKLTMRFRTTERTGLLFFVMDNNGSNTMTLEQVNGQIFLSYLHLTTRTTLRWTDSKITSPDAKNTSYTLCDNKYHTINVRRSIGLVELKVNNETAVAVNITEHELIGMVYVGGVPSGLHVQVGSTGQRLVGCIESVIINDHVVDFRHEVEEEEFMEFGCRAPIESRTTYTDNPLQVFNILGGERRLL